MITRKKCLADAAAEALNSSINTHTGLKTSTESLAQTPTSNTGLNSQNGFTAAVDWLDVTFRDVGSLQEARAIVSEAEALYSDEIEFHPMRATFNGKQWDGSGQGVRGTRVFYDSGISKDGTEHKPAALKIVASGSVVGPSNQSAIAIWLKQRSESNSLDCTRIDVAMDDHEKRIKLGKIAEARKAGNFFNASDSAYIESGKRGQDIGITLYFGSTTSNKRLCVYDKTVESKGKIVGNRWEARFNKKSARETLFQWIDKAIESKEALCEWYTNIVTGIIDFRDRTGGDPNRYRCPRLGWFSQLINALRANPIRVRVSAPIETVQKAVNWIEKSVAPTIYMLKKLLGSEWENYIDKVMTSGSQRMSNVKRKLVESTDINLVVY